MRLELGTCVRCTDDKLGELADVVIDPISKHVTHLVVQGHGKLGPARLVPIDLVRVDDERQISLSCSLGEASHLEPVQDFAYVRLGEFPLADPNWDVGIEHVLAMPYYQTGELAGAAYAYDDRVGVSYDRVPKGEVEIRRSSEVISADGQLVGHVDGFLVGDDDRISHVVLERGHFLKRRELTIPIGAVTKVETDCVTVGLSASDLRALPSVSVQRWRT